MRGDCLKRMKLIPDNYVDMVMCDLPYGTTACKWDAIIPFDRLWAQYRRIVKLNGAVVLTATQPFTSALIMSNTKSFKHNWIWNKRFAGNFVQAKNMPLRTCEDVLVFEMSSKRPNYSPQMIIRDKPIKQGGNVNKPKAIPIIDMRTHGKIYDLKFPSDLIEISNRDGNQGLHPTQKPVALMEYMIKTYTNEGMVVLDNCMGSGTTGVACIKTNRRFIGIEKDREYYAVAKQRLKDTIKIK